MESYAALVKTYVEVAGPVGAIIAGVIIAGTVGLIFYAKSAGLFDTTRSEHQKTDFITTLMSRVDSLEAREAELYRDLERNEAENERLKDRQRELQTQVALARSALRRAIDLLRAVKEGRLSPEAIETTDTVELHP